MPETVKEKSEGFADAAIGMTAEVVGRFGPRVSGTESNRAARDDLFGRLLEVCTAARRESFPIHPGSLFSIGKVFAVAYFVGAAGAISGIAALAVAALGLMALCVAYFVSQFILYGDAFDPLFKKAEAENLVGVVEPAERTERQVLLVGHHDSAPIYPFYERAAILYPIRLFVSVAFYAFCMIALSISLAGFASGRTPRIAPWEGWLLILGLAAVAPMYGFMSRRGSPGASDNLIGCAIALQAAKALRGELRSTRLIVLFADGEEVGQKGARAFIRRNGKLLRDIPTSVINIDTIVDERDLTILDRDRNGLTPLSAGIAGGLKDVAADLGHRFAVKSMPLGGGGTDAGQFARAGIEAASIVGIPMDAFRGEILFHTSEDTPDRISRAAVAATIDVVREYLRRIDARPAPPRRDPSALSRG